MDIRTGSEEFVAYKAEPYMLDPEALSYDPASSLGTFTLAGYTNVPGWNKPNALRYLQPAGMARRIPRPRPSTRTPGISVPMTVSGGADFKAFLSKALRVNAPAAGTYKCMPVFALAVATKEECGSGSATQEVGRFCQFNTWSINITQQGYVSATSDIWPLFIERAAGATLPSIDSAGTEIQAAGSNPFVFEDMSLLIGPSGLELDYTPWVQSITISGNNKLQRISSRPIIQGYPLAFAPRLIVTMGEEITITLNMIDKFADTEIGGTGTGGIFGDNISPVTIVLDDGEESLVLATSANFIDTTGQQEGEVAAPITYTASIMSADLSIT